MNPRHLPAVLLLAAVLSAGPAPAPVAPARPAPPPAPRREPQREAEPPDATLSPEAADAAREAAPPDAKRADAARLTRQSIRLIAARKWAEAEAVLEDALSARPDDPVNLYNLACVRVKLGRADSALECLERSLAAGFMNFALLGRDPDLDPLRGLPRFQKLLASKEQWQRRAAEGVAEALRQRFGDEYLYSVDFDQKLIFATNVDEQTLDELKESLRAQAVSQQKELFAHKPDAFITVVVPSAADYRKLMRLRNVGGIYLDGSKTLIAQQLGAVVRHEFTHALHAADRAPLGQDHAPWVAEGLGVMYEAADLGDDGLVPRGDNPRYAVAQAAARRRSLVPLDRLVKMPQSEFMSRPNLTYPESGAVMFYLRERGILRKFYDAYKATCDADPTAASAIEQASGQPLAEFEASWKQWLLERSAEQEANDPRKGNAMFLGVRLRPGEGGLAVAAVHEGGPGEAAGLAVGDVLVSINGHAVRDFAAIRPAIGAFAPGREVTVTVRRDGREIDLPLKLKRLEPAAAPSR